MKRIRIIVETERVLVFSKRRRVIESWCDGCGHEVRLLRAEDAAALAGVGIREICRQVESANLHYTETADRVLLICLDSLLR